MNWEPEKQEEMAEYTRIDEIDERSEQVREVMGKPPSWTIRWGTSVIFTVIFILILISFLVRYPDQVQARIVITTPKPPTGITAQSGGKLSSILVHDKQEVVGGEMLAIIENPAKASDVFKLQAILRKADPHFKDPNAQILFSGLPDHLILGEAEKEYSMFLKSYKLLQSFLDIDPVNREIESLKRQLKEYRHLIEEQEKQNKLFSSELEFAQDDYLRSRQLYAGHVISDKDMDDRERDLLQVKRAAKSFELSMANTRIQLSELNRSLTLLSIRKSESLAQLTLSAEETYTNLVSALALWEQKYILKAPLEGRMAFIKYWSENQFVKAGDEVFVVVPGGKGEIIGRVTMPVTNSGKVGKGQRVNVRLDSYPYQEFGMLTGKVESVSLVPRNNLYTISVLFPEGLSTTYRRKLQMMQEMEGSAQIVTEDLLMIERIFYQFKSFFRTNGST